MISDLFFGLFEQFKEQLTGNQFFAGMLMTGMLGAGAFMLRTVPARLWNFLYRQATIEVTFRSGEFGFDMANEFVLRNIVVPRFSRVFLLAIGKMEEKDALGRVFQPGYGRHLGWYKRRPVIVNRIVFRENHGEQFKEEVTLTFFTRNQRVLEGLVDSTHVYMAEIISGDRMRLCVNGNDYWRTSDQRMVRRDLSTVFLANGAKEKIVQHLDRFYASEDVYARRGIPYHTGIFLYGPPGTGKSSLIHALASHYRKSIYYLNLGNVKNDGDLMSLMGRRWDDSILVIEDIDSTGHDLGRGKTKDPERSGISMSSVLNLLDGLLTPHGQVVIATSNKPETLDEAMIRKGRFDLHVELGLMDWNSFSEMASAYGYDAAHMRDSFVPMPPVEARSLLMAA